MGRLILDRAANGITNMSIDQALLNSENTVSDWTLRIYYWNEPTLSLGYFQKYLDRNQHLASQSANCVRRSTGGGAILHDDDITYSLICPASDRWSRKNQQLYFAVHGALQSALALQNISVDLYSGPDDLDRLNSKRTKNQTDIQPFLCFLRRAEGDIVLNGHKVCGSAQHRSKQAILQHGSLNFTTSSFAPEIKGLGDLMSTIVDRQQFMADWIDHISKVFGRKFEPGELTDSERSAAEQVASEKYGNQAWNEKR